MENELRTSSPTDTIYTDLPDSMRDGKVRNGKECMRSSCGGQHTREKPKKKETNRAWGPRSPTLTST
jgi:hypothetical protein